MTSEEYRPYRSDRPESSETGPYPQGVPAPAAPMEVPGVPAPPLPPGVGIPADATGRYSVPGAFQPPPEMYAPPAGPATGSVRAKASVPIPGGMQPGGMPQGGMQPGGMPQGAQPGGMQFGGMQPGQGQPGGPPTGAASVPGAVPPPLWPSQQGGPDDRSGYEQPGPDRTSPFAPPAGFGGPVGGARPAQGTASVPGVPERPAMPQRTPGEFTQQPPVEYGQGDDFGQQAQGGFGPQAGGYGPPPAQGGFGPPPAQAGFGPPPAQSGFGQPPTQGGFGQPGEYGQTQPGEYGQAGGYGGQQPYGQSGQPVSGAPAADSWYQGGQPDGQRFGEPFASAEEPSGGMYGSSTGAQPPVKKRRGAMVGLIVVVVLIVLAAGGAGVMYYLKGSGDANFAVGSCVKQSGNSAVSVSCSDKSAFKVVTKTSNQTNCPDQNQPFVVVEHDGGQDDVFCLRPAAAE